jgi:RNA polymerase sigma factor (sigma-70 family)
MENLAAELSAGLRRMRKGYVDAAEALLEIIDPQKEYPFEFVVYRLTGYRPRPEQPGPPLSGESVRDDLLQLMLEVSDSLNMPADAYAEPVYDTEAMSKRFNVAGKTIQRWRQRGLPARKLVFPDGRKRVAFLDSSIRHFVESCPDQVERSTRFTQLSDQERQDILRRAKRMAGFARCTLSEVARRLARRTGRAVETIRYTIRRHDGEHPGDAVFPSLTGPLEDEERQDIYRTYLHGSPVPELAERFRRTRRSIYRVVNEMRAMQLLRRPITYVYSPQFALPDADEVILGSPGMLPATFAVAADAGDKVHGAPKDLPPYLRALYEVPLLSVEQERNLFRLYNYLKYKADTLRRKIDISRVRTGQLKEIENLLLRANVTKNQVVRANLRLVVSIAKKHVGGPQGLFELISDGNVSLMMAVEKFDYLRGNRFSTYASWAIMRNFARSVPKERFQLSRFATGGEEVLDIAAGMRTYDPARLNLPELRESIDAVLAQLSPRERTILIDHYGLDSEGHSKTFDQLGQNMGISKERVRQIELEALEKVRRILRPQQADLLS